MRHGALHLRTLACWLGLWLLALGAVVGAPAGAHAQAARLRVADVGVEGNLRVETEAVLRRVQLPAGTQIGNRELGDAIRRVYALGFFEDVQVEAQRTSEGIVLTFRVVEKPAIGALVFEGNRALDDDELDDDLGLRVGQILDEAAIGGARRNIEERYRQKGYYLVDVRSRVEPLNDTEVQVIFTIDESAKVRIARVTFVGNDNIASRDILRFMETRPASLLGFMQGTGGFQRSAFQTDLQRIRFLYYDRGYLDVQVFDPVLELGRDRSSLYVTIPIVEGDIYTVSDVSVSGDMLTTQEDLMELVRLAPGESFRSSAVRDDIERITNLYRDAGYANANVNMLTQQNEQARTIGVQYDVEQGEICYIGRIEFVGNTLTRDRVMRRVMLIQEGDQYNGRSLRDSERFIRQLGFFEEVEFREQVDATNPRIIDLQVQITERPTRSFQVGAGFSSVDSFLATAQISENNLFGRGQLLTLNAMLSAIRTMFVLSFVEPFLFDTRVQLSTDLFIRQLVFPEFERDSRGANLTFGFRPLWNNRYWRNFTMTTGYNLEDVRLIAGGRFGRTDSPLITRFAGGLTSALIAGVAMDQRNDRIFTTQGYFASLNAEFADRAFGSVNEFVRTRATARFYVPMRNIRSCPTPDPSQPGRSGGGFCRFLGLTVFKLNTELGFVGSTTSARDVPITERFYSGGPNSVRGFWRLTLGPTEPVGQRVSPDAALRLLPVGGHKEEIINAELEFPLVNAVGIRGVVFADAGNSLARDSPFTLRFDAFNPSAENVLRTAVGFGFRWRSPIGPLRFEWGYPLAPRANERRSVFEFSIQNSF
jgi:outer membrane protein insertion porin family